MINCDVRPRILAIYGRRLTQQGCLNLRQAIEKLYQGGSGKAFVVEDGENLKLFQLVDGRWRSLNGEGDFPAEDEAKAARARGDALAVAALLGFFAWPALHIILGYFGVIASR
jgi:hypothetical protein